MTDGRSPRHDAERSITCPWCRAPIGQPCVVPSNGRTLPASHEARTAALTVGAPIGAGAWPTTDRAAS